MLQDKNIWLAGLVDYVHMVWLFVVIFTVLLLCLCYLYLSKRRAEEREYASSYFSSLMIEELEAEQRRISRELHDTVLPQVRDSEVSALIRSICLELMPPDFTRLSLKDSLADLCTQFSRRSGIECACSMAEDLNFKTVSAENQLHLYRMVQESFTNIEKHSQAHQAVLVVRRADRGLSRKILFCVSDDGVGLGGLSARSEGLGIRSMRQRAAILGAKLDFFSESGNGLMVRIEVPEESVG